MNRVIQIEGDARSILSSVEGEVDNHKPINRVEEGVRFLQAEIANGPVPTHELIERAKRDFSINEHTLQGARERWELWRQRRDIKARGFGATAYRLVSL